MFFILSLSFKNQFQNIKISELKDLSSGNFSNEKILTSGDKPLPSLQDGFIRSEEKCTLQNFFCRLHWYSVDHLQFLWFCWFLYLSSGV